MKRDIESVDDITQIVSDFYTEAMKDETIGYIFTDVAKIDLPHHIPKIVNFWEGVLLNGNNYRGNPMLRHIELSEKSALLSEHFERWLVLWKTTIDSLFSGEKAELAKYRADLIAQTMLYKLNAIREGKV
ncbi:MAG: group III truncated hemoglobin [Chitinophagales bacterium]|nr:group III truncated hemoglobin [Chitinophagales bacterium]